MTLLGLLLAMISLDADEAAFAPREGVLLLRNQHVLQGRITPLGDYVHVTLAATSEVRIPRKDVWLTGRDLQDLYEQRVKLLRENRLEDHLVLADWCLRQKMPGQAADQLVKAMQIDPADPRVVRFEKKLQAAAQPEPPSKVQPAEIAATVGREQLERTVNELPDGALERFAIVVQPIVMDRCGAASCHGSGSTSNFQIVQPTASRVPSRRFTQRNLFAVMSLLNRDTPEESTLLKMAKEAHGGSRSMPIGKADERQYEALRDWVLVVSRPTVDKSARPLSVANRGLGGPKRQMDSAPEAGTESSPGTSSANGPAGQDPFDPALFNSRFFDEK